MAIFALGIMPYITSSIIMQLLTVVIPKLEQWQKEGEPGTKKITQWTRYVTVVLALLQSTGLVFLFHWTGSTSGLGVDIFPAGDSPRPTSRSSSSSLTAGTAMIMWLGELITQRGIGNGMSILIFSSVISRLPAGGQRHPAHGRDGQVRHDPAASGSRSSWPSIFIEQGQRRIPVQYAKRVVGRRMTTGGSTYIPLKVNQAGVIPIIFASLVLYFPTLLAERDPRDLVPELREQLHHEPAEHRVHGPLRAPGGVLRVLLHGDHVQPHGRRRQHQQVRGFHPGHPARAARRPTISTSSSRGSRCPGSLFLATIALLPSIFLAF